MGLTAEKVQVQCGVAFAQVVVAAVDDEKVGAELVRTLVGAKLTSVMALAETRTAVASVAQSAEEAAIAWTVLKLAEALVGYAQLMRYSPEHRVCDRRILWPLC